MPSKKSIPVGTVFARLTVLGPGVSENHLSTSICKCACGTVATILNKCLLRAVRPTESCGCLQKERASAAQHKHGFSKRSGRSPTYKSWTDMIQRSTNPNSPHWMNYGGRGIKVCDRWRSFETFLADMGDCPKGLEIDRWPDKNGNYEPGNCRWATTIQQGRNKRNNRVFTVRGLTACLSELCELFGVSYSRTIQRLDAGWDAEEAFFKPKR